MTAIVKQSAKVDVEILSGSTFEWDIVVKNGDLPRNYSQEDIDSLQPYQVDDKTVEMVITPFGCDSDGAQLPSFKLTVSNGGITLPDTDVGLIQVKIMSDESSSFEWTDATYSVEIERALGDVIIPVYGRIVVVKAV